MSDGGKVATDEAERALGRELLKIHEDSYDKGASHARVYIHDDLVICMLDGLELLPNEKFLLDAGRGDAVIEIRGRYQQAIETTFRAAVERTTGRRVISFASVTKLDPHYAVEVFRLAEKAASPVEETG